ncbi:hypothetical protein LP420_12565 [Massilia sp. B-10]|nr:hypothetical protein LP420_12565 [Massilia sp. B-10]
MALGADGLELTAAKQRPVRTAGHRCGRGTRPAPRVLPHLPGLERAPPPPGKRFGCGAAGAHGGAGLGPRESESRVVHFSAQGESALRKYFE